MTTSLTVSQMISKKDTYEKSVPLDSREPDDSVQVCCQSNTTVGQAHEHLVRFTTAGSKQLVLNMCCVDQLTKDVRVRHLGVGFEHHVVK